MSLFYHKATVLANPRAFAVRQIDYGSIACRGPCTGPISGILGGYQCFHALFTGILTAAIRHWEAVTKVASAMPEHLNKPPKSSTFCTILLRYLLRRVDLLYGISGNYRYAFHEQFVLLPGYLYGFVRCPWPAEGSYIETLIQEQETVTFPEQSFYPVRTRTAEEKEYILLMRIEVYLLLMVVARPSMPRRRSVYPTAMMTLVNTEASFNMGSRLHKSLDKFSGRATVYAYHKRTDRNGRLCRKKYCYWCFAQKEPGQTKPRRSL